MLEVESKYHASDYPRGTTPATQANPNLYQSKDTESLLIFSPKEEAFRDSYNNPILSMSQNKMLKEAMDHMKQEN